MNDLPVGWFTALQSAGIILSFFISAYTAYTQSKARKVTNYIEILKSHRDIWKLQWDDDDLKDILADNISIKRKLTNKEHRFLVFLFLHISATFELAKVKNIIKIEALEEDVRGLLLTPLPRRFWEENQRFYNDDFVNFVNGLISHNTRDI